jgi:hypothetical protein
MLPRPARGGERQPERLGQHVLQVPGEIQGQQQLLLDMALEPVMPAVLTMYSSPGR